MTKSIDALIAEMAEDLWPVSRMTPARGISWFAIAAVFNIAAIAAITGLRSDILAGNPTQLLLSSNAILVIAAITAALSCIRMANPQLGTRTRAWKWGLALTAVLPIAAAASLITGNRESHTHHANEALLCGLFGTFGGVFVAAALTWWLRKGAPMDPRLAGTLIGVASGATGIVGYGLHCPIESVAHVGIWHVLPLITAGALGRIVLPRFLRW